MTNQSQNESRIEYFDLQTQGIGYINRIREVTPEEGKSFLSVTIAALRGRAWTAPSKPISSVACPVARRRKSCAN